MLARSGICIEKWSRSTALNGLNWCSLMTISTQTVEFLLLSSKDFGISCVGTELINSENNSLGSAPDHPRIAFTRPLITPHHRSKNCWCGLQASFCQSSTSSACLNTAIVEDAGPVRGPPGNSVNVISEKDGKLTDTVEKKNSSCGKRAEKK